MGTSSDHRREIMRLRSIAVSAGFGKRNIGCRAWRFPQQAASTAAYLATNQASAFVPSPTNKTLIVNLPRIVALGIAIVGCDAAWQEAKAQAQAITQINARVIATNIPGASAISQVGTTLDGAVQMFSANSPHWLNGVNNSGASTAPFTGVSNPLGLSNNNAFGRLWPANAPFGDAGVGSSSILDPTGLPLKGAPSHVIGGVYVGSQTNRNVVAVPQQPQVIPGSLNAGAVGTAFLGPSPDGSCRAVFSVVTADGAIVQEHTAKGLDGLAPAGTVQPLLGRSWAAPNQGVEPRLGVLMNPYTATPNAAWQLFVSEPFNNTIAVLNLVVFGTAPNQVFGLDSVTLISSPSLNLPVDLAPVQRDADSINWASNTTLDEGSDFYVANRGDNTIVRMRQNGTVLGIRRVAMDSPLNNASLNGIATSTDGQTIYATFTIPSNIQGGVLALPAF